jgi:adenylate cyclase
MSDIFVSYARTDEPQAKRVAEALRSQGYAVWRDDELPAHRAYADVIEERLKAAKAVVVLWSADAAKSQWVRAEAEAGRTAGTLVQATLDGTVPPLPFNQIQCADLKNYNGDDTAGWRKVEASVAALAGAARTSKAETRRTGRSGSICVLPFANMSGDAEQEYFSDGISEDITTDLSKISALEVTARNTAFQFKGQSVDVCEVARRLGVQHVLEGSVRKAGNRVRITAQLVDGRTGGHVWADRYDRDLTDIFAIQDEISKAIVGALQLKLLPEEKREIENRGTANVEAYNLYLMARQQWVSGTYGDIGRDRTIVRICTQATLLDPDYAQAWALMALAQAELRFWLGLEENALPAAERALAINPNLPEARCVKAQYLEDEGQQEEANAELETALRLDPESWEVNREVARMWFREGRTDEATRFFEKAVSLMDADYHSPSMLITCYRAAGDQDRLRKAAELTRERAEAALAKSPTNGAAIATGVAALATLGEERTAREWIERGLLLDPDNRMMRYNFACELAFSLHDGEAALDMLEPYLQGATRVFQVKVVDADPEFDPVRDNPRFKQMLAEAKTRLGMRQG